jgi:hypothetical protein
MIDGSNVLATTVPTCFTWPTQETREKDIERHGKQREAWQTDTQQTHRHSDSGRDKDKQANECIIDEGQHKESSVSAISSIYWQSSLR